MSNAWEVTDDDITQVLDKHGVAATDDKLTECHRELNSAEVEKAALCGLDIQEQMEYALDEIEMQLKLAGII